MLKLSRRVIAALAKYKLYEKPVPVKCYEIGVSPCNTNRSVPNMKYVHQSLYKNVDSTASTPRGYSQAFVCTTRMCCLTSAGDAESSIWVSPKVVVIV